MSTISLPLDTIANNLRKLRETTEHQPEVNMNLHIPNKQDDSQNHNVKLTVKDLYGTTQVNLTINTQG